MIALIGSTTAPSIKAVLLFTPMLALVIPDAESVSIGSISVQNLELDEKSRTQEGKDARYCPGGKAPTSESK